MKLIKIIRATLIFYFTGYVALCAFYIMKGGHLRIMAHEVRPFAWSIYLMIALGCFGILVFEKTIRTLSKTAQRLFYLGIMLLIFYALMKLFVK